MLIITDRGFLMIFLKPKYATSNTKCTFLTALLSHICLNRSKKHTLYDVLYFYFVIIRSNLDSRLLKNNNLSILYWTVLTKCTKALDQIGVGSTGDVKGSYDDYQLRKIPFS